MGPVIQLNTNLNAAVKAFCKSEYLWSVDSSSNTLKGWRAKASVLEKEEFCLRTVIWNPVSSKETSPTNSRLKMATSPFPSGLWISHLTTGLTNLHVLSPISQSSACLSSLCFCLSPPITLLSLTRCVHVSSCVRVSWLQSSRPTYMKETVGDDSSPSPHKT